MTFPGRTSVLWGFLLPLLLVLALSAGWWVTHRHAIEGEALRAAWRQSSVASLKGLSAAPDLSPEEQARLDRAASDPEGVRQALIEIHELRLAYAGRELNTAEVTPVVLDARGRARYAEALRRLKAWRPQTLEQFAASRRADPVNAGASPVQVLPSHPAAVLSAQGTAPAAPGQQADAQRANRRVPSAAFATADRDPATALEPSTSERSSGSSEDAFSRAEQTRDQAEMRATLGRWAHAMVLNDPHAESAEYSSHMDRYFLRRNVNKQFVEADKAAYLKRGNLTASFAIRDLRFEHETAHAADVSLIKDVAWQRSSNEVEHQVIRSRLHLAKTSEGWKITEEQDFR